VTISTDDVDADGFFTGSSPNWRALRVLGFASATPLKGQGKRYELLVSDPSPGAWRFAALYADHARTGPLLGPAPVVNVVEELSGGSRTTGALTRSLKLGFSEWTCNQEGCAIMRVLPPLKEGGL
jgi:hypothetical protein